MGRVELKALKVPVSPARTPESPAPLARTPAPAPAPLPDGYAPAAALHTPPAPAAFNWGGRGAFDVDEALPADAAGTPGVESKTRLTGLARTARLARSAASARGPASFSDGAALARPTARRFAGESNRLIASGGFSAETLHAVHGLHALESKPADRARAVLALLDAA